MNGYAMYERDATPVLHNCGPGPFAVYKTGAVGSLHPLALAPVLDALGLRRSGKTALRRRLLEVKATLHERGLLRPFYGIVRVHLSSGSPNASANPGTLPWLPEATDIEQQQWILMAFAHAAPPMLLLTRQPDLTYCTEMHQMHCRWFGTEGRT